jgi:hypothetical protein
VLWGVAANVIPRGFGTDKDVQLNLNARVTVDATESHPVYFAFMDSTERGSTSAAEA